jgi:TonB family protein
LQPIPIELLPGREVWLHDLGEGGLSVSGSSRLELGTSAYIRFQFPEANSLIDAAGVIAWSDQSGRAGVRFTRVQPDSTAALRRWLQSEIAVTTTSTKNGLQNDPALESRIACLGEVSELQAVITSQQLATTDALDLIVRRTMELTRASGAAIALREDEEVVCRASIGNAPDVGVALSPTSLSGECFRSGNLVLLSDSESDSRVNPEICRQLNFRSLLVLPVVSQGETFGIVEVLSPQARNFEGGDILVLSFIADLIANVAAPAKPALAPELSPDLGFPMIADLPLSGLDDIGFDLAAQPVDDAQISARQPKHAASFEAPQPAFSAGVAEDVTPEISTTALEHGPTAQASAPGHDIASERRFTGSAVLTTPRIERHNAPVLKLEEPRKNALIIAIGVALLLLVGSGAMLFKYERHAGSVSVPTKTVVASSKDTNPVVANLPATAIPPAAESVKPTPPVPKESIKADNERNHGTKTVEATAAADNVPNELRVVHGTTARPARAGDTAAPDAPRIASNGRTLDAVAGSIVTASTPAPEIQLTQSQGVSGGKLLKRVMPRYPDVARRAGITGDVVLTATIGTDGMLHNLKVISGSPMLREEAVAAARQWRYTPAMLNGKPVPADTRITMTFHQ